jgi:hypothetical protein
MIMDNFAGQSSAHRASEAHGSPPRHHGSCAATLRGKRPASCGWLVRALVLAPVPDLDTPELAAPRTGGGPSLVPKAFDRHGRRALSAAVGQDPETAELPHHWRSYWR